MKKRLRDLLWFAIWAVCFYFGWVLGNAALRHL
jgi:hypothetical protein